VTVSISEGVRHPKIYVYSLPQFSDTPWKGDREGKGLLKIGFTDRNVEQRIREQINAIKLPVETVFTLLYSEAAITEDGLFFKDHDVHSVLVKAGITRDAGEWFECTLDEVLAAVNSLKLGTALKSLKSRKNFPPRPEQVEAVKVTANYFNKHANEDKPPHFLWNAKMRFGKTFTSYQLAKEMDWKRVLVLTYKPAVEVAWREDLETHVNFEGWRFKGKQDLPPDLKDPTPLIWFASFQDALGVDESGNPKAKNLGLHETTWDAVFIDEYHFGAWRDAARSLYLSDDEAEGDKSEKDFIEAPDLDEDFRTNLERAQSLKVKNYLYLSGTPFRALTEGEFLEDQVFNWTYSDEQNAKDSWVGPGDNPYLRLPRMNLLAYEMPEALKSIALNNQSEFSLSEFFKTAKNEEGEYRFIHEREVQKWLDVLRGQDISGLWGSVSNLSNPPLPFEDTNLLSALQHTVWYLPNVSSCTAMAELLQRSHNAFYRDYSVVVAAGTKAGIGEKALPPVKNAIGSLPQQSKSITLSCGKLMTGVTVPAWTGIFMLRELKSPESYFQAAFRVQSPWVTKGIDTEKGGDLVHVHKTECYVLDFSPNRALRQIVDYATRLKADVVSEKDDEQAIQEFMEFLPVLSFDGYDMNYLQASDVINYLTKGISATALARRWNSPELITLNLKGAELLLANAALLASLEKIEMFRGIKNDLTLLITANKELQNKKLTKEPLTEKEKKIKDEATKKRENLREQLRRFVTRIPVFMYLTDDREKSIKEIILQQEPELFEKVTRISLSDFKQLVDAQVFNDSKMTDAVWKFRSFEEPSLSYGGIKIETGVFGGWDNQSPKA
jgi:hypothetical protein